MILPVTILILVEGSLQYNSFIVMNWSFNVTILILVEGSLQFTQRMKKEKWRRMSQSLF